MLRLVLQALKWAIIAHLLLVSLIYFMTAATAFTGPTLAVIAAFPLFLLAALLLGVLAYLVRRFARTAGKAEARTWVALGSGLRAAEWVLIAFSMLIAIGLLLQPHPPLVIRSVPFLVFADIRPSEPKLLLLAVAVVVGLAASVAERRGVKSRTIPTLLAAMRRSVEWALLVVALLVGVALIVFPVRGTPFEVSLGALEQSVKLLTTWVPTAVLAAMLVGLAVIVIRRSLAHGARQTM